MQKNGVGQNIIYNEFLNGGTIEGKVLAVKEWLVKLHLDIDENQSEEEAFWFKYAPPSVNIMYAMPLVGESVRLYFPSEGNDESIITGCIRKNGDTCIDEGGTEYEFRDGQWEKNWAILQSVLWYDS